MTAQPATVTLVGRASKLAYDKNWGTATWTISVSYCSDPGIKVTTSFNLRAACHRVLEQFNQMQDGQMIRVIADVPPQRSRPLVVTDLELLDNPMPPQEVAA